MNVVCIITKEANENLSHIHNRMPLIMSHNEGLDFLNDNENEFLHKNKSIIEDDLDYLQNLDYKEVNWQFQALIQGCLKKH